jgi:hypothetical protein
MDHEQFDMAMRVLASRQSRRSALAAILGITFFSRGVQTRDAAAARRRRHRRCAGLGCKKLPVPKGSEPEFCCKGGVCSCGGECCAAEACFQIGPTDNPDRVFCCAGTDLHICGKGTDATCCGVPCENDQCPDPNLLGLAGSYRRPR